ncbi:Holliday junction branch migration protein RuvA [Candidatus Aerophobetes bacterium]|nr:Holliday junction branch migration protein RuvA [Candidatus Aerophobetes bacterium]
MIYYLKGILKEKSPTRIVVEVGEVGYEINFPFCSYENLPSLGERIKLYVYLHLREDKLSLYGFLNPEDREFFLQLTSLSKIGPKRALGMLSKVSPLEFKKAIIEKDLTILTHIPGIGGKTAQRLVLELGEKIGGGFTQAIGEDQLTKDALSALVSLGYKPKEASEAIRKALKSKNKKDLSTLVREALKYV